MTFFSMHTRCAYITSHVRGDASSLSHDFKFFETIYVPLHLTIERVYFYLDFSRKGGVLFEMHSKGFEFASKKDENMRKHLLTLIILGIIGLSICNCESSQDADSTRSPEEKSFAQARHHMVEKDLRRRDITDATVLAVMGRVLRHKFVLERYVNQAYADHPLPIGEGQTISQPYIVALMTQCLNVGEGDTVLEIGTGSGYQAAVLAEMVDQVYTVEIREKLAQRADTLLHDLGYTNIEVKASDGYFGWEEHAPFDGIIVTAAANHVPPPLIKQLKDGGRIVIPVGNPYSYQKLVLIEKKDGDIFSRDITGVLFVPLVGEIEKDKK